MNRRAFLKVSCLTAAGIVLPLKYLPAKEIEKQASKALSAKIFVRFRTSKGYLHFNTVVEPKSTSNGQKVFKVNDLSFTAQESMTVYGLDFWNPLTESWISADFVTASRTLNTTDTLTITDINMSLN